jgi:hypothetical protein
MLPIGVGLCLSSGFSGTNIGAADTHRGDKKRFTVFADDKLTAFLELGRVTRSVSGEGAA